ncbi:TPA: hypothetical protein ACH3X1_004172 [Trebouxia sp. C0004]
MTIQVTISCKGSPGVHLEIDLPPSTLESSVLKRFCQHYSLSEQDCLLSCNGQRVDSGKRLHEFPSSSTGTVCLEATLRPSAALHIWQAYHQANLADASLANMADIWEGAAAQFVMACRRQAGQPSLLQAAAAIQAADPLAVMFDSNRLGATHEVYLPAVQDAVRPLLQLTQVLLSQSGSFMLSIDRSEHQLGFAHRINSTNSADEAPKSNDIIPDHMAHQDHRIVLLQCSLLLLKLLSFLSAVEAKSTSTDVAKEVLWQTLANLEVELHSYEEAEADCSGLHSGPAKNPASASSQHWSKTECDVSVPLAALLCTTMRQHILQPTVHADICCRLLQAVLLESSEVIDSPKARRLAAVFQSKGILAVALAGLKYNGARRKDKAMNLVLLLRCLVSSRFLLNIDKAENIITLLRMQGLMRISGLLCPVLGPAEASADDTREALKLYEAASIVTESDDPELLPQMQFMSQVAQLLTALVKASAGHSLDHFSNQHPQAGSLLDRHSQDADTRGPENSHASYWSGACEGPVSPSMMREAWPTPTAAAWQEKSAIVLKALSTLRWLNELAKDSPEVLSSAAQKSQDTTAAYQAVGESLVRLLHCCLAGHVLDPNVDFRAIIDSAIHSLIGRWSFQVGTAESLTASILALMLRRLALDHEELLADEHVMFKETHTYVLKLPQAARVWKVIIECAGSNTMRPLMPLVEVWAVVAFHAIVSHEAYCQLLLEHDVISIHTTDGVRIQNVLSALEPSAKLTFGACLACLATRHWDLAAQKTARKLVRLIHEGTLITICSSIQEAVLAPLPWDLSKCISLARVLQRMAHLLKQQPLDNISLQEELERVVGMNLVKLWEASDQLGLKLQLVLGGLLFTHLAERHPFDCTGNANEEQGQELLDLLMAVAAQHAFPRQHSATTSAAPTLETASTAAPMTASASASGSAQFVACYLPQLHPQLWTHLQRQLRHRPPQLHLGEEMGPQLLLLHHHQGCLHRWGVAVMLPRRQGQIPGPPQRISLTSLRLG